MNFFDRPASNPPRRTRRFRRFRSRSARLGKRDLLLCLCGGRSHGLTVCYSLLQFVTDFLFLARLPRVPIQRWRLELWCRALLRANDTMLHLSGEGIGRREQVGVGRLMQKQMRGRSTLHAPRSTPACSNCADANANESAPATLHRVVATRLMQTQMRGARSSTPIHPSRFAMRRSGNNTAADAP